MNKLQIVLLSYWETKLTSLEPLVKMNCGTTWACRVGPLVKATFPVKK
ncbi:UNVERIFIED_CONTAM: hypothetical protein GTU68_024651 [Idotea baltica]|nr:hypothetical protein [Idotea baltica]